MALRHIAAIYFEDHAEMAKKRVQHLKKNGYVSECERLQHEPSRLTLTKKALTILKERGLLQSYPQVGRTALEKRIRVSKSTLQHEIEVLDVKATIIGAINKTSAHVQDFHTWPALYQFIARREDSDGAPEVLVKPDGYFRIRKDIDSGKCEHRFFLEVDRSTETQDTLALKGAYYVAYYKAGGYAEWLGHPRIDFKSYPFVVLMVLKNVERRNNAAERLLQLNPPIRQQVWLTTWKELMVDPLGAIWVQPKEYLEVTKGTAFDPLVERRVKGYRRQAEREEMVERRVVRRYLLR